MKELNIDERLDVFYMSRLYPAMSMTLSHGNARVESGFSANKEMLVENMSEGSLVARRMVLEML